ncbi:MAG: hypothetical protein ABEK59_11730 [Halobacteria archaeon]
MAERTDVGLRAILSPDIDEDEANAEVKKLEEMLGDLDANVDLQANGDSLVDKVSKGAPDGGGEDGGGMMQTGLMGGLMSKMGGSGLLKVTLAGAVGAALLAGISKIASFAPTGQKMLDMFGTAMTLFFRPFGDFLGTLLMPFARAALKMALNFNELYQKKGLPVAIAATSVDLMEGIGDTALKALGLNDIFGDASLDDIFGESPIGEFIDSVPLLNLVDDASILDLVTGVALTALVGKVALRNLISSGIALGSWITGTLGIGGYITGKIAAVSLIAGKIKAAALLAGEVALGSILKVGSFASTFASAAAPYIAAGLVGAGIGALTVKVMEVTGVLKGLENIGQDIREALGGRTTDQLLQGANKMTLGGFEATAEMGGHILNAVGARKNAADKINDIFNRDISSTDYRDETGSQQSGAGANEESLPPSFRGRQAREKVSLTDAVEARRQLETNAGNMSQKQANEMIKRLDTLITNTQQEGSTEVVINGKTLIRAVRNAERRYEANREVTR